VTVLLGIAAISLDGAVLLTERRHAQATADAAARAAACNLYANFAINGGLDPKGTAAASALTTAVANGYTNDDARGASDPLVPWTWHFQN
jgi:uncharacterized membrane protein